MGCETPETQCNGAMDELMAWPKPTELAANMLPALTQKPHRLAKRELNGPFKKFICACGAFFNSTLDFDLHLKIMESPAGCVVPTPDLINQPPHYTFGKIEVISVIEDWGLSFHLAQVVKYVARSKHKGNELEDLRKAQFYLNRLVTSLEKK